MLIDERLPYLGCCLYDVSGNYLEMENSLGSSILELCTVSSISTEKKVLSYCVSMLYFYDLKTVFSLSTMSDIFCVKISLVQVK